VGIDQPMLATPSHELGLLRLVTRGAVATGEPVVVKIHGAFDDDASV